MKSTWVLAGLLLLTICQAAAETPTIIPPKQVLSIKSLTTVKGPPSTLRLCFSGGCGSKENVEIIISTTKGVEKSSEATAVEGDESNCCSIHPTSLEDILGKPIELQLILNNPYKGGKANLTIPTSAAFPICDPPELLTKFKTIRLPCTSKGELTNLHFLINDGSTSSKCDTYSEGDSDPYTKYCQLDESVTGNLSICDELPNTSQEVETGTKILVCLPAENISEQDTAIDISIDTETVDYDSNTINLTVSPLNTALVSLFHNNIINYEMVSKTDDEKTAPPGTKLSNTFAAYEHKQGIDYLVLNLDDRTKAHHGNIPGYDLDINALSVSTLEVNWINVQHSNTYHLACTGKDVEVSCGEDSHCYGYFMFDTEIPEGKVEVTPSTSGTAQTIRRAYPKTTKLTTEAIEVRRVQLQWSDERQITEAEICFQHQTTEPQAYEGVIINSQGEWRRGEGIVTMTSRGVSCIKPMVVLETEFFPENQEITVIVLQRDEDGRRVLASGEAKINANISY